ncbi:MAG: hypothetical protein AABX05_06010 [Nanoarchaeota archaeon]
MEWIDGKTIKLEKKLSDLDNFVLKIAPIIGKHCNYVLISGYVAIFFGRTRTTEDVDMFIEKISREKFSALYKDLLAQGFWAINADSEEELFSMLQDHLAIRFAERGKAVPNMEVKFVKDLLDAIAMSEKIKVITKKGELWVSSIPMQIAYKRYVLQTPKDLEDARHLQGIFNVKDETIKNYKSLFKQYGRI